jgi:hypothetical protein
MGAGSETGEGGVQSDGGTLPAPGHEGRCRGRTYADTAMQLIEPMVLAPYCTQPEAVGGEWVANIGR